MIENRSVATWEREKGGWEELRSDRKFLGKTHLFYCDEGFNVQPLVVHQAVVFKFVPFVQFVANKFSLKS